LNSETTARNLRLESQRRALQRFVRACVDGTKKLQEARSQYQKKPETVKPEDCAEFTKLNDVLQGKIVAPDQAKLAQLSAGQKARQVMQRLLLSNFQIKLPL
jgi:hypothetical protein